MTALCLVCELSPAENVDSCPQKGQKLKKLRYSVHKFMFKSLYHDSTLNLYGRWRNLIWN